MIKTNEELADWIYNRIQQGKHEEIGSVDYEEMNGCDVTISVAEVNEDGYRFFDVSVDGGAVYDNYLNENSRYEDILIDCKNHNVEQLTNKEVNI